MSYRFIHAHRTEHHILIVRAPGARDQHGCRSLSFLSCQNDMIGQFRRVNFLSILLKRSP